MAKQIEDITRPCKDIKQLNVLAQVLLTLALKDIKKNGVDYILVETYRSRARQEYLYCQGRYIQDIVKAGINRLVAEKYSSAKVSKCTWTMNSIHIKRNAVDLIPQRNGKAVWDINDDDTRIIISIMSKYGFECGANWKSSTDSPHYQIKGVGVADREYSVANTNKFITKMIQNALNNKNNAGLDVDGVWGTSVINAIDNYRAKLHYKKSGAVGSTFLKKLLS